MPSPERHTYLAVLPGGQKYYADIDPDAYYQFAQDAIRELGLTTSRTRPESVRVSIYSVRGYAGQLKESFLRHVDVTPPVTRMTLGEYIAAMRKITDNLPSSFNSFVQVYSYEHGHASGYEEVVSIAQDLAHNLKPAIDMFRAELSPDNAVAEPIRLTIEGLDKTTAPVCCDSRGVCTPQKG